MEKDNKIINFRPVRKKRKKSEYKLVDEISVELCRNNEVYTINWYSRDEEITEEDIYIMLKNIFADLATKVEKLYIKKSDCYNANFTLLYYENVNEKDDIRYICIPKIENEKLAEYLFICINIYELKKSGAL